MNAVISEQAEAEQKPKENSESTAIQGCRRMVRQEIFYDELGLESAIELEFENGEIERKGDWPVTIGPRKLPTCTSQRIL